MTPAAAFARLFQRPEADVVLDWLKQRTIDRVSTPDTSDSELRFLEGQRALVHHILTLIHQGKQERK